jgi:hypothetical protein
MAPGKCPHFKANFKTGKSRLWFGMCTSFKTKNKGVGITRCGVGSNTRCILTSENSRLIARRVPKEFGLLNTFPCAVASNRV